MLRSGDGVRGKAIGEGILQGPSWVCDDCLPTTSLPYKRGGDFLQVVNAGGD